MNFRCGAALCAAGCRAASLASTHWVPVDYPPPVMITRNVSRYCQMCPGSQNHLGYCQSNRPCPTLKSPIYATLGSDEEKARDTQGVIGHQSRKMSAGPVCTKASGNKFKLHSLYMCPVSVDVLNLFERKSLQTH